MDSSLQKETNPEFMSQKFFRDHHYSVCEQMPPEERHSLRECFRRMGILYNYYEFPIPISSCPQFDEDVYDEDDQDG